MCAGAIIVFSLLARHPAPKMQIINIALLLTYNNL